MSNLEFKCHMPNLSVQNQQGTWLHYRLDTFCITISRGRCPFLLSLRAKGREQLSAPRERTHSPYRKGCVRRARPAGSLNRREWLRIAAATLRALCTTTLLFFSQMLEYIE